MKQNFWNKKQSDYTGRDTVTLYVALMAALYAIMGAFCVILLYGEKITDWFDKIKQKLHNLRHRNKWEEFSDTEEEP